MKRWHLLIAFVGMFAVAGCGQNGTLKLTQTIEFTGFGFSIDYPQDWFAYTEDTLTTIVETANDFNRRNVVRDYTVGIVIRFFHEPLGFLVQFGLPSEDPTLDDLFSLNITELTGMTNPDITETTIFGVPALRSEYYEEQWDISYAGIIDDEAFFLVVTAPTEEMINDFKPTWELMLESITPIDE